MTSYPMTNHAKFQISIPVGEKPDNKINFHSKFLCIKQKK